MAIRVEYTVHPLPNTYVTEETIYKYVPSEDDPKIKVRVEEKIEHRGGFLIKFMRGHSIRIFDKEHLAAFNAAMVGSQRDTAGSFQIDMNPRLIDEVSGQVVNSQGVPADIEHLVRQRTDGAAADEDGGLFDGEVTGDPVEDAIRATA